MRHPELMLIVQGYLCRNGMKVAPFGNGSRPNISFSCPKSKITWPEYETFAVCGCGDNVRDLLDITFAWLNTTIDWRIQGRTA